MTGPVAETLPSVQHNVAQARFEMAFPQGRVRCDYRLHAADADGTQVMALVHTEVPPALEGRGLAGRIVQAAVDHARAAGWRIRPVCSYVAAWVRRHPETHDLLAGGR